MLTYNLTGTGSDSLYETLYLCIKNDILTGNLKAGERLPSKRPFAKNLGISVITVENAYAQLIAEGFIYSLPKKGFYVSDFNQLTAAAGKPTTEQVTLTGGETSYLADFTSNQTDTELFPFTTWTKTMREVLNENQKQLMTNPPAGGIMELRQNIAAYLHDFRGMHVNAQQIIVGVGTEYLFGLLIQLLSPETVYGLENPGYPKTAQICRSMNVPYQYVDIDRYGISAEALEQKQIDVIHTSPSHHFPTGIVMPISRRYELLGWAAKAEGRYIIEDDYDSELRLTGKPIPTLQSIDVLDKVIYMNTFSKTLSSTVRISYMVLPPALAEKFYKQLSFYTCTVSNFEQYALSKFIQNGSFEKHLNRLRNEYQKKRDCIIDSFTRSRLKDSIQIMEEEAGVHFLMKISSPSGESAILRQALAKGIKLVSLADYYHGNRPEYQNIFVMNYSSIDVSRMEEITQKLYECI